MKVEVVYWPQVADDYRALPSLALKLMAQKHLLGLERKHDYGTPLTNHPVWGDLSDCWKIYLDETHERDPRWRIIYTLKPDSLNPLTAEVIIIGPRRDDAVYVEVMGRLGRTFGSAHPHFANPS